jgi:hypothetical protein
MSNQIVKAGMSETKAGFNTDLAVKELLALLVKKRVLDQKEVDQLLESAKTHPEIRKEYEPQLID